MSTPKIALILMIIVVILLIFYFPNSIQIILILTGILGVIITIIYHFYKKRNSYLGGYCTTRDFINTFNRTRNGHKNEAEVRHIFNCFVKEGQFYEVTGSRDTLPWLFDKNVNGQKTYLDFDGYNSTLNIAFEYNGRGHYENIYNDMTSYLRQRSNDKVKRQQAQINNVPLIIIHYQIKVTDYENYIKSRLKDLGALKQEYSEFTYLPIQPEPLIQHQEIIKQKLVINRSTGQVAYYKKKENPST